MKDEKKFLKPIADVVEFAIEDIIAKSGEELEGWETGNGDVGGGTGGNVPG